MKATNQNTVSELFHMVLKGEEKIEPFIARIKHENLDVSKKYAYQAFCCAILSKNSNSYLQKGKFIKQYGQFIGKSLTSNPKSVEGRIVRLLIEQKLENVQFVDHTSEDKVFLKDNIDSVQDPTLVAIISKITK